MGNGASLPAYLIGYTGGKRSFAGKFASASTSFGSRTGLSNFDWSTYRPWVKSPYNSGRRLTSKRRSVRSIYFNRHKVLGGSTCLKRESLSG